jgi:hypothetical protein
MEPASNTKNTCIVTGTGVMGKGIFTYAPTAVRDAKRAAKTIFFRSV